MMIVPTEFADVQREYPIFFRKDPSTGEFTSFALLGFSKDENLFLEDGHWKAAYVPGVIARLTSLEARASRFPVQGVPLTSARRVELDAPSEQPGWFERAPTRGPMPEVVDAPAEPAGEAPAAPATEVAPQAEATP